MCCVVKPSIAFTIAGTLWSIVSGAPGAAHVGLHPAGMQRDAGHAPGGEVPGEAVPFHVQRRLAGAIEVAAAIVVGEAAQDAGDRDQLLLLRARDVVGERLGHHQRRHDVDLEDPTRLRRIERTEVLPGRAARAADAGIADQDVDRLALELPASALTAV